MNIKYTSAKKIKFFFVLSFVIAVISFTFSSYLNSKDSNKLKLVSRDISNQERIPQALSKSETYYRWGATSEIPDEKSIELTKILGEYSAVKAGKVELGQNESGGKYFHFYIPKNNIKLLEEKMKAVLGDSFYSEVITTKDRKSHLGKSRVVFVLFKNSNKTRYKTALHYKNFLFDRSPASNLRQVGAVEDESIYTLPKNIPFSYYHSWSEYNLSLKTYYSSIQATDKASGASTNFYSKQNFELGASWIQNWTSRYSTNISFSLGQESWDQKLTTNRTFSHSSYLISGFQLGGAIQPSKTLKLSSFAEMKERPYFQSKNGGTDIAFETIPLVNLGVGVKKQVHLKDEYFLGLSVDGFSTLPKSMPNYDIYFSPGVKVGASLRQLYHSSFLDAQLFWEYQKLKTSLIEGNRSSVGLSIIFGFGTNPNKEYKEKDKEP
jgi:hypothetical protein